MDWTPLGNPSLVTRIAIAKSIGLAIGLCGFFILPLVYPEVELYTRIGILLWYPTMGAFVGLFGVMNWHPLLQLPLPWWFRSGFIGAWMNFVLVFFAYQPMSNVLSAVFAADSSPFWYVLVGALAGLAMGFAATRFGGEGPETTQVFQH